MQKPEPVLVAHLFPEVHKALLDLLAGLAPADWDKPTVCSGWSVKDVALHLLGGEIGNLSRRRDRHVLPADVDNWKALVAFVNASNEDWVRAARRISPRLLIDLLALTGEQMNVYFQNLDPFAPGGPVSWAGSDPAPVWLDLAREYTERWHHQQHIRDATGRPGLKEPCHLSPVLSAFMFALPHTYREVAAADGTALVLSITGAAGGRWTIRREEDSWNLYQGAPEKPDAEVVLDDDLAWRVFTRGVSAGIALEQLEIYGNLKLAQKVLEMVAIIA